MKIGLSTRILFHGLFVTAVLLFCLSTPPFQVLSREFTLILQVVAYFLGLESAWHYSVRKDSLRKDELEAEPFFKREVPWLAIWIVVPYAVIGTVSCAFLGCRILDGSARYWISVPPALLLGLALGFFIGKFTRKAWVAVALALCFCALLVGYDALNHWMNDRNHPFSLMLGELSDQRGSVLPGSFHVLSRLWLVVFSLSMIFCVGPHLRKKRPWPGAMVPIGILAGTLIVAWLTQSWTGLGWSQKRVRALLSRSQDIPYWTIHVHPRHPLAWEQLRALEWVGYDLHRSLGLSEKIKVELFAFPDDTSMAELTNSRGSAYAKVGRIYATVDELQDDTISHELVHALHADLHPSWRVLLRRFWLEGTAQAFSKNYHLYPEAHLKLAGLERNGTLPSVRGLLKDLLFIQHSESLAYDASGSFLGFLIQRYGMESFLALQRDLDFVRVYGKQVEILDTEWNVFLQTMPIQKLQVRTAVQNYSWDRAYAACQCPQVGSLSEDDRDSMRHFNVWRDPEENIRLYGGLEIEEPTEQHWTHYRLLAQFAAGRLDETDWQVRERLAHAAPDEPERYDLHRLLFWIAVMRLDLVQAQQQMDAMAGLSGEGEAMDDLRSQLLSHPSVGPAYLAALRLSRLEQVAALRNLHLVDPAFGPAYLFAFQYTDIQSAEAQKAEWLRRFAALTTDAAPIKQKLTLDFIKELIGRQQYEQAREVIVECHEVWIQSPEGKLRLNRLRERLEFEEIRFPVRRPVPTSIMLRAVSDGLMEPRW